MTFVTRMDNEFKNFQRALIIKKNRVLQSLKGKILVQEK